MSALLEANAATRLLTNLEAVAFTHLGIQLQAPLGGVVVL